MNRGTWPIGLLAVAAIALAAEQPAARKPLTFADVGVYGTMFPFCDFSVYKLIYDAKKPNPERLARFRRMLHDTAAKGKRNLLGLYTFDRIKHSRPIAEYLANTDAALDAIDLADVHAMFLSEENVTWNSGLKVLNALYDHIKQRHPDLPVYQWLTMPAVPHAKLKADGWVYDLYRADRETSRRKFMKYLVTGRPFVMCLNASPDVSLFGQPKGGAVSQAQVDLCRELDIPMFFYCVDLKWGSPYIWLRSEDEAIAPWRRWVLGVVNQCHRTDPATLPLPSAQYSTGRAIEAAGDEANRFVYREKFDSLQFVDDATIMGFLNLRWDGVSETLAFEPQAGAMDTVELQYHFVSDFELSGIAAKLTGKVMASAGSPVQIALSATGHNWPHEALAAPGQARDFALNVSAADDLKFRGKEFWVRILGKVDPAKRRVAAAVLDSLEVTCQVAPPARREVALTPDRRGRVAWRDGFDSTKHLHQAHIAGKQELEWRRGRLGTHGVKGRGNTVALRWKLVCDKPLAGVKVRLACSCNERDLGASNRLAASLDGQTKLVEQVTRGRTDTRGRFRGTLELDLSADARFRGVRAFWVHAEMHNGCGVRTGTSNTLDAIEIEAAAEDGK